MCLRERTDPNQMPPLVAESNPDLDAGYLKSIMEEMAGEGVP